MICEIVYQVTLNPDRSLYRISYQATSQFTDLTFSWENVTDFLFRDDFRIRAPCSTLVNPSNQIRIISEIAFAVDFTFVVEELTPLLNENEIIFSQSCCTNTGDGLQYIINITDNSLPLRIFYRYFGNSYRWQLRVTRGECDPPGQSPIFPEFDENDPPIRISEIRINATDPVLNSGSPINFYQNDSIYFIYFDLLNTGSIIERLNNYFAISYCLGNGCVLDFTNLTPPNTQSITTTTTTTITITGTGSSDDNADMNSISAGSKLTNIIYLLTKFGPLF